MREAKRQEKNEELRKMFARHTNSFHGWLTDTRTALMDGRGGLEEQLETVKVCVYVCVVCVCGVCVRVRVSKVLRAKCVHILPEHCVRFIK